MKLFTTCVAVFVLVASCEAGSKCLWGPSYWCQSRGTAKECGKDSYCQQSVWKNDDLQLSVNGAIECEACKLMMGEVEKLVETNTTEAEVMVAIEKVCTLLGPLAGECKTMIGEYFEQIWKLVVDEADPEKVCQLISLCAKSQTQLMVKAPKDTACDICKQAVSLVKPFIDSNSSEAKVKSYLEIICKLLPGDASKECSDAIEKNFNSIWDLFKGEVDSGLVCKQLGLCNSTVIGHLKVRAPKDACSICTTVVSFVKTFVDGNGSEAEVKGALEEVCKLLNSTECKDFVDKNLDLVWTLVKAEVDSGLICKEIGFCNSTVIGHLKVRAPKDACSICTTVVSFVKAFVDGNGSEAEVKGALEEVCKLLKSTECTDLVDKDLDLVWALVKAEVDSGSICKQIGFCNSTVIGHLKGDGGSSQKDAKAGLQTLCSALPSSYSELVKECLMLANYTDVIWELVKEGLSDEDICTKQGQCQAASLSMASPLQSQPKDGLCTACQTVIKFVAPFVNNKSTEQEVKDAITKLCDILPGDAKTECTDFLTNNFDSVWQLLQSEVDNDLICKQIGVCPSVVPVKAVVHLPKIDSCEICKTIVTLLDVFVDKNSTETEVKDALEKVCGLIKSSECTNLITQYFNLVWQLVKGELDNDEFCKQVKFCPSTIVMASKPVVKDSPLCQMCEFATHFLQTYVDNNTLEEDVIKQFEQICGLFPGNYSTYCKDFVDKYLPMAWKMVQDEVDGDKICKDIGLCSTSSPVSAPQRSKVAIKKPAVKADTLCTVCQFVVPFLRQFVDNNKTETEAKTAVEKVCMELPSSLTSQCKSLVDEYFGLIWKLIDSYVDDKEICQELGLCTSSASPNLKTFKALVFNPVQSKDPQAGVDCVICEFVIKEVNSTLAKNASKADIEAALDKVCSILPSTITKECTDFVNTYTPVIVDLLENDLNPKLVCTALGLCTSASKKVLTSPKGGATCVVCEFVMKELDSMLTKNSTEAAIKAALDKVCSILPSTITKECTDFVDTYAPMIVELLEKELEPQQICTELGLCTSAPKKVLTSPKGGAFCVVCEFVMKELDSMLTKNSTEADIEAALDKVCSLLPSTITKECTGFVNTYAPMIVELLEKELDPKQICTELGLCTSAPKKVLTTPKDGIICKLCETVLNKLESYLPVNATTADIEKALDSVCKDLGSMKDVCEKFVEMYTPQIVQYVMQKVSPDEICKSLDLCSSSKQTTVTVKETAPKSGVLCLLCEYVMKEVASLLDGNTSKEAIEKALDEVCSIMPSTVKNDCVNFINKFAPEIMDLLIKEVAPKAVCTLTHLCLVSEKNMLDTVHKVKGTTECSVCTYTLDVVKTLLAMEAADKTVEGVLDKACELLPREITAECEGIVKTYGPQIIQLIDKEIDPKTLCTELKLCKKSKTSVLMRPWVKLIRSRELKQAKPF